MITTLKLTRKSETDEWLVVVRRGGVRMEDETYYTDDKQDAIETMRAMAREYGIPIPTEAVTTPPHSDADKHTHVMGSITEAVKYAEIHGGRIATHHNTHECTWFSHHYTPSEIQALAVELHIDTFGTRESWKEAEQAVF